MPQAIHISPIDNVVVALHPIAKGTLVEVDGLSVTALEDIPQGHKMAVKPIKNGENVIKYGFPIGHATADAAPGSWMHTHNVHTNLSGEVEYSYNPAPDLAPLPKVEPETFMGFRRKDGRAAIRNEIWIIPTVGCVNDIAKKIVADNQDLVTGSIEGLYTFNFEAIRETYLSDLTQSRIRLLRGRGIHTRANAALLRAVLESRALALIVREFTRLANKLVDSRHIVRLMILSSAQDSPEALGLNVFSGRLFLPNNLLGVGFYRVQERLGRPKTRDFRLISLRCQGGWAIFSIRKSPTPSEEDRALSRDSQISLRWSQSLCCLFSTFAIRIRLGRRSCVGGFN